MLKIIKYIATFFIILVFCTKIFCADLKVFVDKREVEINKTFILTVEVSDNIVNFSLPKMPEFVVMPKGSSKKKNKTVYTYEMAPKSEGFFKIPAISVGDTTTIPINIKVYEKGKIEKKYLSRDLNSSVSAFTDTNIIYVNQVLYYTLTFKTNKDLASNPNYTLPMFQDFWKNKSKIKSGYKLIEGENYFTFEVATPLYPMREGILTIDPSSVSIRYLSTGRVTNFETKKVNIKVLPLPETGKPEKFSGAVGKYEISATVNKKKLKVNEPLVLTITVKGNGNINSISEPEIDLSDDMKKYATTVKINTGNFVSSKKFQCVIIPLLEGNKNIPSISFSYFDPDLKEYINISTDKINIEVSGVKSNDELSNISDIILESDENLQNGNGLKIKLRPDLSKSSGPLIIKTFFIGLNVFFILTVIVSLIYRLRIIHIYKDKVKVQKMKSKKMFANYFQQTSTALKRNRQFDFYFYADLSLKMLLRIKTNFDYMIMTKEEIKNNLSSFGIDKNLIDVVMDTLVVCDRFKFTNIIATQNDMKKTFYQIKFLKENFEKKIKTDKKI